MRLESMKSDCFACRPPAWAATVTLLLGLGVRSALADPPAAGSTMPPEVRQVLEGRCLGCHSADEPAGGVDLSAANTPDDVYRQGRQWNRAVRVVRSHEMPPKTEEPPTDEERQRLIDWIESALRSADCRNPTEPGQVTVRRLNRVEYQNTMRDLLGMPLDAARDLPADPAGNGFDNQGDTLFMPPVLLEKYLDTTKRLLGEAMAEGAVGRGVLLASQPGQDLAPSEAARRNLRSFLPRAFRRPVGEAELAARVALVDQAVERGESFEAGMTAAYSSALLSPHFLFRIEQDQAPEGSREAYPITDHELAVRLSYFLWSTMPDEELTRLADEGRLQEDETLRGQVLRMLADERSAALAEDFAAQWFGYRDLRRHEMDIRRFGGFNGLRDSMYHESRAFFAALFRDNGRVLDVLDCDYAYLNAALAEHYGVAGVTGNEIRRVTLSDRRRGGVLGMGSVLTVTSYPTRTSPILRGKWILETLLGTPPPPPPPNVKEVSKDDAKKDGLTLRQRLEQHRAEASCASCHAKMDPLGFSLENFDGIGQWRDQDNGLEIDTRANLPDGSELVGVEGLKDALLARQDLFLRHLVEKTMTYALGRAVDYYDECTIREALARLAAHDYRAHELVLAVVESYPFRYRKNTP